LRARAPVFPGQGRWRENESANEREKCLYVTWIWLSGSEKELRRQKVHETQSERVIGHVAANLQRFQGAREREKRLVG